MSRRQHLRVIVSAVPVLIGLIVAPALAQRAGEASISEHLTQVDAYTFKSDRHLVRGIPTKAGEDLVNVVVEIPAGTNAKWEVDSEDGLLKWDVRDGKPRIVSYLPYPGNYGMVPRTALPKEFGGDGDPLDILVLGPAVRRGEIVKVRIIGVLKFLDAGEQDDKLLAVLPDSKLGKVQDLKSLQEQFGGVLEIVKLWMTNYKGPGEMEFKGVGDVDEAQSILTTAMSQYK
jgi:inorganic pyrophosphatase